jgi:hypothetical protein
MPYRRIASLRARRTGLAPLLVGGSLWVALPAPFLWPVFSGFLQLDERTWGEGLEGWVLRLAVVLLAVLSLDVYSALIRNPDRRVLMLLPVDARRVVLVALAEVAVRRAPLWIGAVVWIGPVALRSPPLFALGVAVLSEAYLFGILGAGAAYLVAVDAATSPRWAGLLDLVRGQNPREQAAFIYAPGAVLFSGGILVALAAEGLRMVWTADAVGWLWLAGPAVLTAALTATIPARAALGWWRGGTLLADIDARWAALEGPESANEVYLQWAVRFLPAGWRAYGLRDLRLGWRGQRTLLLAAWGEGLLAAAIAAGKADTSVGRAGLVVVGGALLTAAAAVRIAASEPEFLRQFIPRTAGSVGARGAVVAAWCLGAWILPAVAGGIFHHTPILAVVGLGATVAATALVLVSSRRIGVYAVISVGVTALAAWAMGVR